MESRDVVKAEGEECCEEKKSDIEKSGKKEGGETS